MRLHWNLAGIHFNALRAFRRSNKFCAKLCYANMDWSRINIICRAPSQMTKNKRTLEEEEEVVVGGLLLHSHVPFCFIYF